MEINNKTVGNITYNKIGRDSSIKLVNCIITGEIKNNTGSGKIECINCEFPNGITVNGNECEIIINI